MTDALAVPSLRARPGRPGRRPLAVLLSAAALAGCARPGPPPGGPADTTPPTVVRTVPADGEVWVDPSTVIEVEFSEEMDRQSVERAFALTESLALRNLHWRGRVLLAEPVDALKDTATFFVRVSESAKDYHGVRLASAFSFAFATGGAISRCWSTISSPSSTRCKGKTSLVYRNERCYSLCSTTIRAMSANSKMPLSMRSYCALGA